MVQYVENFAILLCFMKFLYCLKCVIAVYSENYLENFIQTSVGM